MRVVSAISKFGREIEAVLSKHPHFQVSADTLAEVRKCKRGSLRLINQIICETSGNVVTSRAEILFALDLYEVLLDQVASGSILYDLRNSIAELDSGVVHPLLRPRKLPGRPPDNWAVKDLKITAGVVCEVLICCGGDRSEAAKAAAARAVASRINKRASQLELANEDMKGDLFPRWSHHSKDS